MNEFHILFNNHQNPINLVTEKTRDLFEKSPNKIKFPQKKVSQEIPPSKKIQLSIPRFRHSKHMRNTTLVTERRKEKAF